MVDTHRFSTLDDGEKDRKAFFGIYFNLLTNDGPLSLLNKVAISIKLQ